MSPSDYVNYQDSPHLSEQTMAKFKIYKLQKLNKILYSVIPFILILVFQIRHSESTRQLRLTDHDTNALYEADPIVFNSNSLYKSHERHKRSTTSSVLQNSKLVDACQSRMEVLTPYYATNSKGKLRTIVNSELMQQAIQVETCLSPPQSSTGKQSSAPNRCNTQTDCACEQKYKWHRLLVADATDEMGTSQGLFMDWFLFPSNCVCRCRPSSDSTKNFLRTMMVSPSKKQHHTHTA